MSRDGRDFETDEQLVSALGALAEDAPTTLAGRVFAHWTIAPSRLGEVYVAFSAAGVQYLRPAESADAFIEAYHERFARPLLQGAKPPVGVLPSLQGRTPRNLVIDLSGATAFEQAVLGATRRIPAGQTRPYRWIAREAGNPRAVRAVGSILARNPVPLLVPCHRVVRADGAIGDYIFGTGRKEGLLRAEGVNLDEVDALARDGVHYLASDTTGIVCFPTCRDARRITPVHRRGFSTIAAAAAAGYRPCMHCRPAA